jgi:cyclohexanone monooxygenase
VDIEAIRSTYRLERDRRIREDGQDQYVHTDRDFASYSRYDPFAHAIKERPVLSDEVKILVVGGGFAGLFAAARLKEAGFGDIRIVEAGADFGGTWYWNRYPGCQCDVESYCYLPLLEATGYVPQEKYACAPEIFEYCRLIGNRFRLYEHAIFQTRITGLCWQPDSKRWRASTDRGDSFLAQHVFCAIGYANRPKLPGIPGLRLFQGKAFHSARWDYGYTGGDYRGGLTKLADKNVAIIGTGASAIQLVPHLGACSKQLYVFQRTPSSVDFRRNTPTDLAWFKQLEPGWQKARQDNLARIVSGRPVDADLIQDSLTIGARSLHRRVAELLDAAGANPNFDELLEMADYERMQVLRARVDEVVLEKRTGELLKPWYRYFCKRPTFSDEYLQTFNRPNVTLVDTSSGRGVGAITSDSVVVGDREYKVDCIVFATGFELNSTFERRIGFKIVGRNGKSVYEHWKAGPRTLHGYATYGFPNWFLVPGPLSGTGFNYTGIVSDQVEHVAHIIAEMEKRGFSVLEATTEGEQGWVDEFHRLSRNNRQFLETCTPGYFNNEGTPMSIGVPGDGSGIDAETFNEILRKWRADGSMSGLSLA